MKTKRLLFLVMAICLANGVKAQFYDSADDICYYVEEYYELEEIKSTQDSYYDVFSGRKMYLPSFTTEKTGKILKRENNGMAMVFNFDGMKAAILFRGSLSIIKDYLKESSSYCEDKVETTDYDYKYSSTSYKEKVRDTGNEWKAHSTSSSWTVYEKGSNTLIFSPDRNTLIEDTPGLLNTITYYKRVDKSYFKVGRSRTPNSTMHE